MRTAGARQLTRTHAHTHTHTHTHTHRRGKCDDALLECTNKNSLFKIQSRYVVERCDPELWDKVGGGVWGAAKRHVCVGG